MSFGPGGIFGGGMGGGNMGGGGPWYTPRGPYGAYPGCGCSSVMIVLAGLLLVFAGLMRGCNM